MFDSIVAGLYCPAMIQKTRILVSSVETAMTHNACPECGSVMEEGFIPDLGPGQFRQLAWQRGTPVDRKFLGLFDNGVKVDFEQLVNITARRCTKCGFLKLYAKPESE
jgi:ribosomal protein S27AE